jgi:hypothetical protein
MSPPACLPNSHEDGGRVFLTFVADPRTVRLYLTVLPRCYRPLRSPGSGRAMRGPGELGRVASAGLTSVASGCDSERRVCGDM